MRWFRSIWIELSLSCGTEKQTENRGSLTLTHWTPETVFARLIEAAEIIAITTRRDGHRRLKTLWPDAFEQGDYPRGMKIRRTASPAEIDRAEEASGWWALIEDLDTRRSLQYQVMSAVSGASFAKICEKNDWKRTTVISRNSVELKKISEKLNLERVSINSADARHLRQNTPKNDTKKDNLEKCATHWRDFEPGPFDPENFDPSWAQAQAEKRRRKKLGLDVEDESAPG